MFNDNQFQCVTQHGSAGFTVEPFWQILISCSLFLGHFHCCSFRMRKLKSLVIFSYIWITEVCLLLHMAVIVLGLALLCTKRSQCVTKRDWTDCQTTDQLEPGIAFFFPWRKGKLCVSLSAHKDVPVHLHRSFFQNRRTFFQCISTKTQFV